MSVNPQGKEEPKMLCQCQGCEAEGVQPVELKFTDQTFTRFYCRPHALEMFKDLARTYPGMIFTGPQGRRNMRARATYWILEKLSTMGVLAPLLRVAFALKRGFKFC
jgi:hypothetical protein